jgi:HK97 family phage major capsid protein
METLKQLHETRASLHAQIKALADRQSEWTAEDQGTWDSLNAAYDSNYSKLESEQSRLQAESDRRQQIEARLGSMGQHAASNPRIGRDGGTIEQGPHNRQLFGGGPSRDEQRALAVQAWLRVAHDASDVGPITDEHHAAAKACGVNLNALSPLRINLASNFGEMRAALSSQNGAAGGYTFSDSFVASLEQAMLAYGGMFTVADVIRTSTAEPLRWPTANDTANTGRQIGESQPVTTLDPTFAQVIWNAYKFTSDEILVPFELLRDNAVNLVAVLSEMLGERLGRIQNTKYTTGSGANTPKGIVTCAAAGVTAASATAIAFDELIDLEHSLDPSRRRMPGVGYMFHDSILKALRKLKDGEGRYLWQSGANSGAPDTLNTFPYTINQDMASAISSGAVTVLFGQMSKYKIRQVNSIRLYRLTERHRENDQDAFLAFAEGDGNLLDAGDNPVKKLTQA